MRSAVGATGGSLRSVRVEGSLDLKGCFSGSCDKLVPSQVRVSGCGGAAFSPGSEQDEGADCEEGGDDGDGDEESECCGGEGREEF